MAKDCLKIGLQRFKVANKIKVFVDVGRILGRETCDLLAFPPPADVVLKGCSFGDPFVVIEVITGHHLVPRVADDAEFEIAIPGRVPNLCADL